MEFRLVDGVAIWDNAEEIPQNIKDRAEKLKGKTFSKTEFEKLLLNTSKEELLQQEIDELKAVVDVMLNGGDA